MLTDKQKKMIIDAVEEELFDMGRYQFLTHTQVAAVNYEDMQIQILITKDEEDFIDCDDDGEEEE